MAESERDDGEAAELPADIEQWSLSELDAVAENPDHPRHAEAVALVQRMFEPLVAVSKQIDATMREQILPASTSWVSTLRGAMRTAPPISESALQALAAAVAAHVPSSDRGSATIDFTAAEPPADVTVEEAQAAIEIGSRQVLEDQLDVAREQLAFLKAGAEAADTERKKDRGIAVSAMIGAWVAAILTVVTIALTLMGCGPSAARTEAAACTDVTSSWDEFTAFSLTPGRDDAEMLAQRDEMLATWASAIDGGSDWTKDAVSTARDAFEKAVSGTANASDAGEYYGTTVHELERFVAQCQADGNLAETYEMP